MGNELSNVILFTISGSAFKKIFFDSVMGRAVFKFLPADDFLSLKGKITRRCR
ncbi:MAG: hypothetical protein CM15mV85_200 [uncultured marine virus]|nr:MAG: hypothetical protein CM15mV85_200 [uncultured marine virus]